VVFGLVVVEDDVLVQRLEVHHDLTRKNTRVDSRASVKRSISARVEYR